MYSKSPSRNHRSRGIKVKHILQICLLVAVCFWLIYQVKRSHEKKKEFDKKDAKLASETQSGGEILRLGRKDISRMTGTGTDDKLHGEDDEENEVDEEENRHEENEQERGENMTEDREEEEDTSKGDGDDERDKREEEKIDDENDEEFLDEEKEREEGDEKNEDNDDGGKEDNEEGGEEDNAESGKEDNEEGETTLEDQDEGGVRNTHEAREEQYNADDASSEVAHDTRTIIADTENATVKHTNGNYSELITDGKENVSQSSIQPLLEENSHEATKGTKSAYSRVTGSNEYKDNLTVSEYSSSENSTTLRESNDQSQASNNMTQFKSEQSTNMIRADNTTYEDGHNEGFKTPTSLFSQANTADLASDKNQLNIRTVANFTQLVNTTSEGSLVSSGEMKSALAENATGAMESKADDVNSTNAGTNKSSDSTLENNATAGENESSISDTANDNADTDLHDSVDDSSLTQEEKEYRTDLETLPDIKVEVQGVDDVEAE